MEEITVNGKKITVRPITFEDLCALEDMGISIITTHSQPLNMCAGMVAVFEGISLQSAQKEISEHLKNGGSFMDFHPIFEAVEKSDFFQSLQKEADKSDVNPSVSLPPIQSPTNP
jgi:hypothetical protein